MVPLLDRVFGGLENAGLKRNRERRAGTLGSHAMLYVSDMPPAYCLSAESTLRAAYMVARPRTRSYAIAEPYARLGLPLGQTRSTRLIPMAKTPAPAALIALNCWPNSTLCLVH